MSDQYDTPLTPEEQTAYQAWAQTGGKDPEKEKYDYDLQGYYKSTKGAPLGSGHLTDQFKKPNHPTFSDQSQYHSDKTPGGSWIQNPDGSYNFTAGKTNLENWGPQGLQSYFNKYEPGNKLIIPEEGQ